MALLTLLIDYTYKYMSAKYELNPEIRIYWSHLASCKLEKKNTHTQKWDYMTK